MRLIRLCIEYDGTGYRGWQTQREGRTVQDVVADAVHRLTGEKPRLTGASRTDAGVHALGQVAAFATESALGAGVIMRALNSMLPPDIRVLEAADADNAFHPRYSARQKRYFYLLCMGGPPSAFLRRHVWDLKCCLDLAAMRRVASTLLGEHDFSSFRGSGCSSRTQIRTVYRLEITRYDSMSFMTADLKGNFVRISIEANAFLRHMVRNIVGTLVEVGRGKISEEEFGRILLSCDRTMAGPTAPARGLFLEKIFY
jgi:tRNA pseudouridine38-40 synthase